MFLLKADFNNVNGIEDILGKGYQDCLIGLDLTLSYNFLS